jgi:uncharacterized protein
MNPQAPSPFVWFELMSNAPADSIAFYRKVAGWNAKDSGMPGMSYTILSVGETSIGGILGLTDEMRAGGARPCWIGYVGVADVDADAKRVAALGGKVLRAPDDIPGVGRWAMVTDPYGAPFVIFRGTSGAMPTRLPHTTPGTIGWRELHAGDREGAWKFYSEMFGWQKRDAIDMGEPAGIYQTFSTTGRADEEADGGMMTKMPAMPVSFWQFYIFVDGAKAGIDRATAAGAKLFMGPHQVPGGSWIANLVDPDGAVFALVSPSA